MVGLSLYGCLTEQDSIQNRQGNTQKQQTEEYSFDRFGVTTKSIPIKIEGEALGITSGDFDGDGDIDIATIIRRSSALVNYDFLKIYENKIPQKTGEQR